MKWSLKNDSHLWNQFDCDYLWPRNAITFALAEAFSVTWSRDLCNSDSLSLAALCIFDSGIDQAAQTQYVKVVAQTLSHVSSLNKKQVKWKGRITETSWWLLWKSSWTTLGYTKVRLPTPEHTRQHHPQLRVRHAVTPIPSFALPCTQSQRKGEIYQTRHVKLSKRNRCLCYRKVQTNLLLFVWV